MFQSRGFAARDGSAVKSHSTILQRLRRQISLDYYTIPPATQASRFADSLPADVLWGSFVTHSFLPHGPWGRNECVTNEPQRTSAGEASLRIACEQQTHFRSSLLPKAPKFSHALRKKFHSCACSFRKSGQTFNVCDHHYF